MNDFTAIAIANETEGLEISNISFFPAININDVRKTQRLDGTVTTERLKTAIASAIIAVNDDLYSWRLAKQSAGITTINDLNDELINGESRYLILYKHAVYSWANALLNEQYINFDATAKAKGDIEPNIESVGNLYRNARYAIRDILGKSRSTMELI
ncbi:head completion/stabilization protein [Gilliamella sp. B2717]|uniref:head completion/stabilization protein n=1 Tax=Gilliamella sp. B2717 TaxID=2817996 RepID=UPI00226A2EC8|nr:head completion/stabilization protein [Gilliamella sp. B2717]MCX8578826.1 head completion/stabilization protein [Gilliamella sp. B2717]